MKKRVFILSFSFLLILSSSAFADEERDPLKQILRYKLLYDDGEWIDGEFIPDETMPYPGVRWEFYRMWNEYRAEHGLQAVKPIKILENTARISAQMCATREDLDHDLFDGYDVDRYVRALTDIKPKWIAENLVFFPAKETEYRAEAILNMWISSPDHNSLLLDEDGEFAGLGGYTWGTSQFYCLHLMY